MTGPRSDPKAADATEKRRYLARYWGRPAPT